MRTSFLILVAWVALAGIFLLSAMTGCAQVSSAAKAQAQANLDQGAINDSLGTSKPLQHPVDAGNAIVKAESKKLEWIFLVSFVALGAGIGLYFTPLSYLNTVAVPVLGGIAGLSFVGAIAVNFGLWLLIPAAGLIGYELYVQLKGAGGSAALTPGTTSTGGLLGTIEGFFKGALGKIETSFTSVLKFVEGLATELYDQVTGKKATASTTPAAPAPKPA